MEEYLRDQKKLRDSLCSNSPYVFFWFGYRADKDGQKIEVLEGFWAKAVIALQQRAMGVILSICNFHDLRRSAHYQMRKAGIDRQTRRDIMGHESTSMGDRYTMIDDEALKEARRRMDAFQRQRGLLAKTS